MAAVFSYLKEKKWFAVSGNRPVCLDDKGRNRYGLSDRFFQMRVPVYQRASMLGR